MSTNDDGRDRRPLHNPFRADRLTSIDSYQALIACIFELIHRRSSSSSCSRCRREVSSLRFAWMQSRETLERRNTDYWAGLAIQTDEIDTRNNSAASESPSRCRWETSSYRHRDTRISEGTCRTKSSKQRECQKRATHHKDEL